MASLSETISQGHPCSLTTVSKKSCATLVVPKGAEELLKIASLSETISQGLHAV